MADEEHIRKIVSEEVERLIRERCWPDEIVLRALLDVAKSHIWKQGLWIRFKILSTIAGGLSVFVVGILAILSLFGIELVRS